MDKQRSRSRLYYVVALSKYIQSYRIKFFFTVIVHMIFKTLPVAIGFISTYMMSIAIVGRVEEAKRLFFWVLILVLLDVVMYYLDIYVSHDIAYRILTELRLEFYKKADEIAPAAMEDKKSGDMVSIMMSDIEALEWFYAHTIGQWVVSIILPLIASGILFYFSPWLPLVLIPFVVALFLLPVCTAKKSNLQGQAMKTHMGELNAIIVDGVQGLQDVISFCWQKTYFERVMKCNEKFNESSVIYQSRGNFETKIMTLIIGLATLTAQVVVITLIKGNDIDKVWMLPLFCLTALVFSPIQETIALSRNYGLIFAASKRLFDFFQREPLVSDSGKLTVKDLNIGSGLRFDDVYFSYPNIQEDKNSRHILDGVNFAIRRGETIALVGESGAGKTTIAKLLQRFWDINEGHIFIGDTDIRELRVDDLRKLVTVVPQEIYLFNRTVKENLVLANTSASDADIISSAQKAQIMDTINKMEDGWETVIGERGTRLSGGEKQRLAIAQAFLKDSPILVLDEASASLDSENEKKVNLAVKELKKGRITLIIAHRLSTIKSADRIIFLRNGKVEDVGTYVELTERSEHFCDLIGKEIL